MGRFSVSEILGDRACGCLAAAFAVAFGAVALPGPALSAPAEKRLHAISLLDAPRYGADFKYSSIS